MKLALHILTLALLAGLAGCNSLAVKDPPPANVERARNLTVISTRKIWEPVMIARSVVFYKDNYWALIVEKRGHSRGEGKLRILRSRTGETWESTFLHGVAGVSFAEADLTITPGGRLMIYTMGRPAYVVEEERGWEFIVSRELHHTIERDLGMQVFFSDDGVRWTAPTRLLKDSGELFKSDISEIFFQVTWHKGRGYALGRDRTLYVTDDGITYAKVSDSTQWVIGPDKVPFKQWNSNKKLAHFANNESTIQFREEDDELLMFCRNGWFARSKPPYTHWFAYEKTSEKSHASPGCNFILLPNGEVLAGARRPGLPDGSKGTGLQLLRFDFAEGEWQPLMHLKPYRGTTCYPGFMWNEREGLLWVIYNSNGFEAYLAKIKVAGLGKQS